MASLPKPEVIFTHESDLDGFVSGLLLQRLARSLFGIEVPIEAYHNHNWRQRTFKEKSAWVTDMTFDERLDRPDWVIIDHHATSLVPKKAEFIHHPGKSASLLCYELCQPHGLGSPNLDRLVHLTNVGDLFLEHDPEFLLANDYANLIKTYQFWNVYELVGGDPERLLNHPLLQVMEVKRRVEDPLGYEWSRDHVAKISATVGFVDIVVGNSNLIVHQLLERGATPYPVLTTLFRKANGTIIASFRSRDGQAIQVAEKLQGGGHPNAAGATLPRSVQQIKDAVDYLRTVLNPAPLKNPPLNSMAGLLDNLEVTKG